jgi:hypothetical protein
MESPFPSPSYSVTDFCLQNATNGLALYTVTKMVATTTLFLATVDVIRLRMPPWPAIRRISSPVSAIRALLVSNRELRFANGNAEERATSTVLVGRYDGGPARFSPDCSTVVFGVADGRKTAEEKDDGKMPMTTMASAGQGFFTGAGNGHASRTMDQTISDAAATPPRGSINKRHSTTPTKPSLPPIVPTDVSSSYKTWSALGTLDLQFLGTGGAPGATRLITLPLFGRVYSPVFMPDGHRVLFSSNHDNGKLGFPQRRTLYMTTGEGGTVAQVL